MNTVEIKALATSFTNACRVVSDATKNGVIEKAKGSVGKDSVKVSTTIKAGHSLTEDALKALKKAMQRHNAGHAFQEAFGIRLAHLATYADQVGSMEAILNAGVDSPTASGVRPAQVPDLATVEA